MEIIYVQAGWVFIGLTAGVSGGYLTVNKCKNIRNWGTTAGLGEIALNGPTRDTVLDNYGTVKIPIGQILFRIPCVTD